MFKGFLKIIALAYINQSAKFGDLSLVTVVRKIYLKKNLASWTKTHHDVTDLVNHEMVKNAKTWISWERNITFLEKKKILNLCLRWHILRSYHFLAEVTFKFHTQRMERIKWISRCRSLYWIFKKFLKSNILEASYTLKILVVAISGHIISFADFWTLASNSGKPKSVDSKQN